MSHFHKSTVQIGAVLRIGPAQGQVVSVIEGKAWITQGDERDLVLEAGETVDLDGPGEALITALQGRVVVEVAAAAAPEQRLAA